MVELMGALEDIRTSCNIAVQTLNDILTYDKLEAGDITLDSKKVPVVDFIVKAVSPFGIQVIRSTFHTPTQWNNILRRPSKWG